MLWASPRSANLPIANGADCGIALDARGCTGEQHRAMAARQHAPDRLLRYQEAPERVCGERSLDLGGRPIDERPDHPERRVVDHHVGRADPLFDFAEQLFHLLGVGGVAGKPLRPDLLAQCAELLHPSRRQAHPHALAGEKGARARR